MRKRAIHNNTQITTMAKEPRNVKRLFALLQQITTELRHAMDYIESTDSPTEVLDDTAENEHLLIAKERKLAAQDLEACIDGHGLAFTLETIARIAQIRFNETDDIVWAGVERKLRLVAKGIPEEWD